MDVIAFSRECEALIGLLEVSASVGITFLMGTLVLFGSNDSDK